jgi:outer membrane protein assembly factor BamA
MIYTTKLRYKAIRYLLFGVVVSINTYAQKTTKRVSLIVVPIAFYTPETRWGFGAGITSTFRFKKDDSLLTARPSQASFTVSYTQNKQVLVFLPFQVFYDNNRYYTYGEVGYFKYNYLYYGIGNQVITPEPFAVTFPRIKLNLFKKIHPNIYAGLRYQYEDYAITKTILNGELAKNTVPGTPRSRTSGVGLGLLYDTRDMVFFPSKGIFADFSFFNNSSFWGGNTRFNRLSADISAYKKIKHHTVWVNHVFGSFIWGKAPFNMLSEMGGAKKLRGYFQGQLRDQNALLVQSEARFDIYKRLGGVVFGSTGWLGNQSDVIRFNHTKYSYGAGLRFTLNTKEHLNIRLDYALGKDVRNFYLTIGEAF